MSVAVALLAAATFCRPADLLCRFQLPFDAVAAGEVPDFLPITAQCVSHGPCPSERITVDQVQDYVRSVSPSITRVPDSLTRILVRRVEDYHYRCNQEIKAEFASAFSAADFSPVVRQNHLNSTAAFFSSREGRNFTEARSGWSVRDAAAPYGETVDRLVLAPATTKRLKHFLRSEAGQWWAAARANAWRRILGDRHTSQPQQLCFHASEEFDDARVGALVRAGLTEPIVYRDNARGSRAR